MFWTLRVRGRRGAAPRSNSQGWLAGSGKEGGKEMKARVREVLVVVVVVE